ncbi:NfeD family protein [Sulfurovum sp. zt1-1]|uniref:NfeD family protein n=1 Tax=Sulfurovum zhangzhouensis TaxID=3019067 RepID=A0ABT7R2F6_9BACT|nr:NfeD family protein [Sulfurovum zhangzhouensis]MDM5272721.1 NfeD family protein [Sulfurovum zhangzhouensis]
MIAFLNDSMLWWHWIILGIILLIIEMNLGTFFILGLGVAAILVGVIDLLFGTSFNTELLIWIILSLLSIAAWFKWFREPPQTDSGQSNYRLDTLGSVLEEIEPHSRGKVKFDSPVLGNTTWHATAKVKIAKDIRVKIVQINGQLIEVEPV